MLRGLNAAIIEAKQRHGISAGLIVCVLRDQPVESAERMLDAVIASNVPVLGIGLDSAEVGYPPQLFRNVFDRAAQAGLHRVAHAGEEGPAEYIWQAIDVLGAERIDHGVRAVDDPKLVQRLALDQIPLTVCPLSNVRLRVVERLEELPFRQMLDEGLMVTVNSDDPAYFGGYLRENLEAVRDAFRLSDHEVTSLGHNSVQASFLTPPEKERLMASPSNPASDS